MLLQLRKHNIAKNYSKENQELQIKSSRIVNMIKHFISSPQTSSAFFEFFKCHWPPSKEKGPEKTKKKYEANFGWHKHVDSFKRRSTDNPDTL